VTNVKIVHLESPSRTTLNKIDTMPHFTACRDKEGVNHTMRLMRDALARYSCLPISIRRHWRDGWIAELPTEITANGGVARWSNVRLCDWGRGAHKSKAALLLDLSGRYGGQHHLSGDTSFIPLRQALKHPNWGNRYGALPELVQLMRRAGLITLSASNG
jgi:hypothetical protein